MISAFFLLSLFTIQLGTQARILPAAGENGTFEFINVNYNNSPPPPPAPNASSPKTKMNNYRKEPSSPPPPPSASLTIGEAVLTTLPKPKMSDYGIIAKSPPPPPYASPTKGHVSSTILKPWTRQGGLEKTPQSRPHPRDIWIASTFVADC
ncbi:hypothetical protein DCAR_0729426 [Daucus carota subsp. sativus]|uniref:Uncharacterized protein n=2 Tax=Daucus carota subsp. sativus TaxID=79200 RepID=A0A164U5T7_DAUCS|nr:hypothetical protein DCAR_0729426 [Daucus carota subsp. sativus]